ncbi:hypothetical protein J4734_26825 [Klebsiella pneumoniae]|uniref:Uncharacterized protein n=1 Tax=Klebsiella pneumoniae TaxID=573 RepID=A0A939NNP5_KLEPN|nr:hypothetical protein [Klebsiella pneumoniae]
MRKITFSGSEYFQLSPYGQGFYHPEKMGPKDILARRMLTASDWLKTWLPALYQT